MESGKLHSIHLGSAGGHSLSWSSCGCLAVASRDKRLCIFDVERGIKKPIISMTCHQGSKPWKAAFLDNVTVATVGFGPEGSKEVVIWDLVSDIQQPLKLQSINIVSMSFYYFITSYRKILRSPSNEFAVTNHRVAF